ncbi:MAG: hypothetical protein HYZ00_12920, partial [Candidatus Hydrogenedentes bacterium]|nr:hypothetical protein [Candidatus Hydrogenedentota bacterium]
FSILPPDSGEGEGEGEGESDPRAITVTAPDAGAAWLLGTSHEIRWETLGDIGSRVFIQVYPQQDPKQSDSFITLNDGVLTYSVPELMLPSNDYLVRVSGLSGSINVAGESGVFSILAGSSGDGGSEGEGEGEGEG